MKRILFLTLLAILFAFNSYAEGPKIFGGGGGSGDMTEADYVDGGYLATDKGGVGVDLSGVTGIMGLNSGTYVDIDTIAEIITYGNLGDYAATILDPAIDNEAQFKAAVNLESDVDFPAIATTVQFSTQTDSGLTGASDTVTLTAGYKENHRLLLSSDTDGTALTFAETDSGASAITDQTHIVFINTGANTLTFTGSSGEQEGNYAEYEQYDSGVCDYVTDRWVCAPLKVTTDFTSAPPIIAGDPDSLDDTLATNGNDLYYGGTIIYNAAGEATIDAFTIVGQNVAIEFYPSVAIIVNPNASQTITLRGVALAAGEALINSSSYGICTLTYIDTNSIQAVCSDTITEETP